MNQKEIQQFTSWLGKRSYSARLKRLGLERLQEIARENGRKGGRPRLPDDQLSQSALYQRARQARLKQQAAKAGSKKNERQKGR